MAEKKKHYFFRGFLKIVTILPSIFGVLITCGRLIEEEVVLIKKNLINFIIICIIISILLTVTWVCFLGIILFFLISLKVNLYISLLIIMLINLLLIFICSLILIKIKENLSLNKTRNLVKELMR